MMLNTKQKSKIIEKHRSHATDSGSAEIQIAILSEEIRRLALHLKKHAKDNHSRRGLLGMVARRRKLLDYLARTNARKYNNLVKKLGLKK
ncbi:MAG: 30S ribosomal protein S15 [Candidatus Sungbacteria bacterium RIFCSPLOWO2_02_FULL_51_17]|uniref:Small ribosomal subunit protein uS15 n=1 Tax=Candidatus Sungbacteria bacterium RIFCSPHIGHO2_02_FULL_51_29 TaxID=1802273 RepID=A0A1G2KSR8_9BACT|nr:MAG: 30S ribosomal protein S15 [Candidatus Sungbacteria bacterium RIFCSPHIGHO2_01_FULL_51_22]OHA02508.1 MAG: 30S ribosomal protein S15 [Candidatus Sungbacteria bacterium RIFCSPHIGHO2_02_FULL_51_29]OHA05726.1 MAG: 30S ribosomal protein S15 [Candidatus Sungbacteria bacterium RIFCSPLOWO2_01_FULL_51_34]OHA10653.1 MAG: 30S ribosomal protein S15 [Candidatus Sungbacteria bacterium RIFCSPLOWO2_02_FULL_51_17]